MKITRVQAHHLSGVPVAPPPFREVPRHAVALLLTVGTSEGITGWSLARQGNPSMLTHFINSALAAAVIGDDPRLTERIRVKLEKEFSRWKLGDLLAGALSALDIALWDIKGKAANAPVHQMLGGASDRVQVYITFGATYENQPPYSIDELTAEARSLVAQGNRFLKMPVGRQDIPDLAGDVRRLAAVREAIGPDIKLAMDARAQLSLADATKLAALAEGLDIAFFEEPVLGNDPFLLRELKNKTGIPLAAPQRGSVTCRDLLLSNAVDIIQPNVNVDGGYTVGMRIAAMALAFNRQLGHGNGAGPHNVPLHAAVSNGGLVEYHFQRWMMYNAIFEDVPQVKDGFVEVSQTPGVGLTPRAGIIEEYALKAS